MLGKLTIMLLVSKEDIDTMKDFEDMTLDEREEILEQVRNLPDEPSDPIDVFTHSFNELSQNWSNVLKEFDSIYSDCNIGSHKNIEEKDENSWCARIYRYFY